MPALLRCVLRAGPVVAVLALAACSTAPAIPPVSSAGPTARPVPTAQPAPAGARVLSLDDAIALAQAGNEQVAIAQAGATRAVGNQLRVRSEKKPQLTGSASYDRALQSEFSGLFDSTSLVEWPGF